MSIKSIDQKKYADHFSNDLELAIEVAKQVLSQLPIHISAIQMALQSNNENKIKLVVHTLRGNLSHFSCDEIDSILLDIETVSAPWPLVQDRCAMLIKLLGQLSEELKQLVQGLSSRR